MLPGCPGVLQGCPRDAPRVFRGAPGVLLERSSNVSGELRFLYIFVISFSFNSYIPTTRNLKAVLPSQSPENYTRSIP